MRKVIDGNLEILLVLLIGASIGVGFSFALGIGTDKTESFRKSLTCHGDISEEEES